MKYVGILLILVSAYLVLRGYKSHLSSSLSLSLAFLSFLKEAKRRAPYLEPMRSWASKYKSEPLLKNGFLSRLSAGKSLKDAFLESDTGALCESVHNALAPFFTRLGTRSVDEEIELLGALILEVTKITEKEKEELAKRVRVAGALIFAIALGLVLIIL